MRVYELSAQNRILSVSDNWDGFAVANAAVAAMSHAVMGRPIWDFVSGLDTRSYMNALFFAVRSAERKIAVRYRCDGLEERRHYQLQIEPLEDGALRLAHLPIDILPRQRPVQVPSRDMRCCGQCLRWRNGTTWEESDAYHALAPRCVDYVVCPSCRTEAQRAIDAALQRPRLRGKAESPIQSALPC